MKKVFFAILIVSTYLVESVQAIKTRNAQACSDSHSQLQTIATTSSSDTLAQTDA